MPPASAPVKNLSQHVFWLLTQSSRLTQCVKVKTTDIKKTNLFSIGLLNWNIIITFIFIIYLGLLVILSWLQFVKYGIINARLICLKEIFCLSRGWVQLGVFQVWMISQIDQWKGHICESSVQDAKTSDLSGSHNNKHTISGQFCFISSSISI